MQGNRVFSEAIAPGAMGNGAVAGNFAMSEGVEAQGFYTVECIGPDGKPKWSDTIKNVVTTVGKNDLLDKYLAGSAYTAAFYLGLISSVSYTGVPVVGDTMASHSTWTESAVYSNATRPAPTFNAASAGSKATTATAFNINASDTIKGCFLTTVSTKSGTTGILYSAGLFTGGDKVVANGDTLNVTYTAGA
jgi:hypothetical protein